jgi:hypothetical protein
MKQTYVLKQISKLNELDYSIDEWNKKQNELIKQITIWDDPEYIKRNKPAESKQFEEDSGVNEEVETFNGAKSEDFSPENWKRFKRGLPIVLPKVFRPKRLDGRNSITVYGRKIYIVKKNVNMTPTKEYCVYDVKTGIFLCYGSNKIAIENFLIDSLQDKLHLIEEED